MEHNINRPRRSPSLKVVERVVGREITSSSSLSLPTERICDAVAECVPCVGEMLQDAFRPRYACRFKNNPQQRMIF